MNDFFSREERQEMEQLRAHFAEQQAIIAQGFEFEAADKRTFAFAC